MKKKFIIILFFFSFIFKQASAQLADPVHWSFHTNKLNACEFELVFQAKLDDKWHLYSQKSYGDDGPYPTSFHYTPNAHYELLGKASEETLIKKFEPVFNLEVYYFEKSAVFKQKFKIKSDTIVEIKGDIEFMVCSDVTCMPPSTVPFHFKITGSPVCNASADITTALDSSSGQVMRTGFLIVFAILLFHCAFLFLPFFSRFFTKNKETDEMNRVTDRTYTWPVLVTYFLLGVTVTFIFSSDSLNTLSTNKGFNIALFLLFLVFGSSFLGVFELNFLTRFVNKMDLQGDEKITGNGFNIAKIIFGFFDLAIAVKFASNVDLAFQAGIITREVFISLWIVIFGVMGIYLMGKLKFSRDEHVNTISVPRLFFAILAFSFTIYLIPGLWGAPLKRIRCFSPPSYNESPAWFNNQHKTGNTDYKN